MASKNEEKIQNIVNALASKGIIASGGGATITGNQIASTIRAIPNRNSITRTDTTSAITYTAERGYYASDTRLSLYKYTGKTSITPSKSNQSLATRSKYVGNDITILGDTNLIPANIRSGVSIFGVNGTYTVTQTTIPYVRGSIKSLTPNSIIYYNTTDNYFIYYDIMQYAENTNEKVPLHSLLVYASTNSTAPPYYTGLTLLITSNQSTPRIFVFEVTSDFSIEG